MGNENEARRSLSVRVSFHALLLALSVMGGCKDDRSDPNAAAARAGTPTAMALGGEGGAGAPSSTGGETGAAAAVGGAGAPGVGGAGAGEPGAGGLGAAGEGGAASGVDTGCPLDEQNAARGDSGELLFNVSEPCEAHGRALFILGDTLYWHYESADRAFVTRGSTSGGAREVLVSSVEPIGLVDVRGVLAYQAGQRLFAFPPSSHEPIELEGAPPCKALSSTLDHVYCASIDGPVLRWPSTGGPSKIIASVVGDGFIADAVYRRLLMFQGWTVSYMPLSGVGSDAGVAFSLYDASEAAPPGGDWHPSAISLLSLSPDGSRIFWLEDLGFGLSRIVSRAQALNQPAWTIEIDGLTHNAGFLPTDDGGVLMSATLPDASGYVAWAYGGVTISGYYSARGALALAQDRDYAYWIDATARIYRARRPVAPPASPSPP